MSRRLVGLTSAVLVALSASVGAQESASNLLNRTNFGNPDGNISNPTAGMITTAADARSMQLGPRLAW